MLPVLAVIAAAVLFGTTGTSQALGPDDTSPLGVGAMRLVIGGTTLAALGFALGRRHRTRPGAPARPPLTRRTLLLMALTGVCLAAYQPLFFLGTARSGVAVGTVIALGSAPVLAGLIEWARTRRIPRRSWVAATGLATFGVVLLVFAGGGASGMDPVGVLGSLGAGASFAVFANAQRQLLDEGWDPFTVAGAMGLGSAVCALVMLPFASLAWLAEPSGIAMALWLGLATIVVAYALFTWGLQRLTAATAATLTLAEPLTAALLGILVLGERLDPFAVAGLLVLAAGLALLAWAARGARIPVPLSPEGPRS
jgi:DME family drug/metabolite transporter